MSRTVLVAATAVVFAAGAAEAQTRPQAPPAPQDSPAQAPVPAGATNEAPFVDRAQQGVLVFGPAFFASSNPDTALDMILRLPGFSFNTGDTGTRGFAGAAGNVLIDGARPSSKSDSLDQIVRRISADGVERIELIRGGAPGIDMQGQPVVANIVLRRTVTVERVVEVNSYFYPEGETPGPLINARYSRRAGEEQMEGSISATDDLTDGTGDGYRRRKDGAGALIQDAELERRDRFQIVTATGAVQRMIQGGKLRVNGLLNYHHHEWREDVLVRSGAGLDEFNGDLQEELNGELGLNWTRDLGARTEVEITALQRLGSEEYVGTAESAGDSTEFGSDSTAGESIGRGVLKFRPNERWAFESGGEVAYNFLNSDTTYAENGVAIPLPGASVKVEELRGEVFGQTTWRPSPRLTVEAGARIEVSEISQSGDSDQSKTFTYPKPRLQLTWTPAAGRQIRVRVEREVGQLDFGDFVASAELDLGQVEAGNPDLEPYKGTTYEAVYERRFWGEAALVLTGRYADFEDWIDVIPLVGGFEAVGNVGDAWQTWLEIRTTLPLDKLGVANGRLQARASWAESEMTDPLTGEQRRTSVQVPFACALNFQQDLRGGRWSYGLDHGCNSDDYRQYRIREVRYFENEPFVTAFVQWKPEDDLTVRFDLGNATDRESRRYREIHAGPRDTTPVVQREEYATKMFPWLFIQIRKSL